MTFLGEINNDRVYLQPPIAILSLILQQNHPPLLRMKTQMMKKTQTNRKMVMRDRRKRQPISEKGWFNSQVFITLSLFLSSLNFFEQPHKRL